MHGASSASRCGDRQRKAQGGCRLRHEGRKGPAPCGARPGFAGCALAPLRLRGRRFGRCRTWRGQGREPDPSFRPPQENDDVTIRGRGAGAVPARRELRRRAGAHGRRLEARQAREYQARAEIPPRRGRDHHRQPRRPRLVGRNRLRQGRRVQPGPAPGPFPKFWRGSQDAAELRRHCPGLSASRAPTEAWHR